MKINENWYYGLKLLQLLTTFAAFIIAVHEGLRLEKQNPSEGSENTIKSVASGMGFAIAGGSELIGRAETSSHSSCGGCCNEKIQESVINGASTCLDVAAVGVAATLPLSPWVIALLLVGGTAAVAGATSVFMASATDIFSNTPTRPPTQSFAWPDHSGINRGGDGAQVSRPFSAHHGLDLPEAEPLLRRQQSAEAEVEAEADSDPETSQVGAQVGAPAFS